MLSKKSIERSISEQAYKDFMRKRQIEETPSLDYVEGLKNAVYSIGVNKGTKYKHERGAIEDERAKEELYYEEYGDVYFYCVDTYQNQINQYNDTNIKLFKIYKNGIYDGVTIE